MRVRGIPLIAPLTRLASAQIRQSFTFAIYIARELNPTCIQKDLWADGYRSNDPSCIQKNRSLPIKGESDPTCIQKEPSWALNEVTID